VVIRESPDLRDGSESLHAPVVGPAFDAALAASPSHGV
jgi:hypothetical protein